MPRNVSPFTSDSPRGIAVLNQDQVLVAVILCAKRNNFVIQDTATDIHCIGFEEDGKYYVVEFQSSNPSGIYRIRFSVQDLLGSVKLGVANAEILQTPEG